MLVADEAAPEPVIGFAGLVTLLAGSLGGHLELAPADQRQRARVHEGPLADTLAHAGALPRA